MIKIIDFESARAAFSGIDPVVQYDWVDWCLRNRDAFQMPAKMRLAQNAGDYFACMPCMLELEDVAIAKMIGRHVAGAARSGGPAMSSDIMVYEASTGRLKALVDGEYLTTLRTGACAAHAGLLYSKKGFDTIGLIGLGNIMTACFDVLLAKTGNRPLTVKLYRHNRQEERFAARYAGRPGVTFEFKDNYCDVIGGSDLIISAVTRAEKDFCSDDAFMPGCTVIPIMTLGFQNCDLFFDRVFSDEIEQIRGFKYFDRFRSVANTSDVLRGDKPGRTSDDERILVYNYGLALLDLYYASKLVEMCEGETIDYRMCSQKFFMV